MLYLDTSAAMKLVRPELHSAELSAWLGARVTETVVSSVLIEVELIRATRRSAPERLANAAAVLRGIGVVTLGQAVIDRAAGYAPAELRSLDAVHLATAEHLQATAGEPLQALVAYDERLLAAARRLGLPTATPGVDP